MIQGRFLEGLMAYSNSVKHSLDFI